MKSDIFTILPIPSNSSFSEVKMRYNNMNKMEFHTQNTIKASYKEYCKNHKRDIFLFYIKEIKLMIKILFGIGIATVPMYMTYMEGFKGQRQFVLILFCSIYLFFAGWGVEALSCIQYEKIKTIPLIGTKLYIILKLGIGIAIGGLVALFQLFSRIFAR
ncbi:hypothetical protein [Clostridium senegalense]|uniref:Uncharacterized protein n=1 Tax=Clostridium senegalense TaxID=1465809 RepID=A0A6M0H3J4_9CLOT|nr:hypothetical protein [Clostridium senegalense]NEU05320.1 hypothetical protein [Clostridium senegalense]